VVLDKFLKSPIFKDKKTWDAVGNASVMGLHLVSGVLVGLFIGYWLDVWLGTKPWLLLLFLLFGIAAGFRNIYLEAKKFQEENTTTNHDDQG
jgi:ATP synthase protein I